jgi:hypothetical protein
MVSSALISTSAGLVLTDANPSLFSSEKVPKNSSVFSGVILNRPPSKQ